MAAVLKQEKVGYLKSKISLLQGTLYLTEEKLVLQAHKAGVGGGGILGFFLKKKVEEKNYGFNLEFSKIKSIQQGKQGLQKNILEVTDIADETYRIVVKNYSEWETEITKHLTN
ncbi:hypothetical protein ACE193_09910 [Bernardetia sp. OM2101]|uniref:hypothetical protein n=1 Tax=Bernardetia sp. OM2101 TaxID=3344876 RepID=UPI0035D064FC